MVATSYFNLSGALSKKQYVDIMYLLMWCDEKGTSLVSIFFSKTYNFSLMRKHQINQIKGRSTEYQPVFFKTVKVIND